ncbi:hypothetical protein VTI28DRAFT_10437 [Corynascus sepedonium]
MGAMRSRLGPSGRAQLAGGSLTGRHNVEMPRSKRAPAGFACCAWRSSCEDKVSLARRALSQAIQVGWKLAFFLPPLLNLPLCLCKRRSFRTTNPSSKGAHCVLLSRFSAYHTQNHDIRRP